MPIREGAVEPLGGNIAQALVRADPAAYAGLAVIDSTRNTGPLSAFEARILKIAAPVLRLISSSSFARIMANASAVTEPARRDAERAISAIGKSAPQDAPDLVGDALVEFLHQL